MRDSPKTITTVTLLLEDVILAILRREKVAVQTHIVRELKEKLKNRKTIYRHLKRLQNSGLIKRREMNKRIIVYELSSRRFDLKETRNKQTGPAFENKKL